MFQTTCIDKQVDVIPLNTNHNDVWTTTVYNYSLHDYMSIELDKAILGTLLKHVCFTQTTAIKILGVNY